MKTRQYVAFSVFLSLFLACEFSAFSQNQQVTYIPKTMQVCSSNWCDDLRAAGDHYDSFRDGASYVSAQYYLLEFSPEKGIKLYERSLLVVHGTDDALEATYTTKFSADGMPPEGTTNWTIGKQTGTDTFRLRWDPSPENLGAADKGKRTDQNAVAANIDPLVDLPPGAADEYTKFPPAIRAVLQPDNPLLPKDDHLPCSKTQTITGPDTALEIARYAFRAAEYERGICWASRSAALGSHRANVLLGIAHHMAWIKPRDEAAAFRVFLDEKDHDAWAVYFLYQCYQLGLGTEQNQSLAEPLNNWIGMHAPGIAIIKLIGSDNALTREQRERQQRRWAILGDPPMKTKTVCFPTTNPNRPRCEGVDEVDEDAVQRQLNEVDNAPQ